MSNTLQEIKWQNRGDIWHKGRYVPLEEWQEMKRREREAAQQRKNSPVLVGCVIVAGIVALWHIIIPGIALIWRG